MVAYRAGLLERIVGVFAAGARESAPGQGRGEGATVGEPSPLMAEGIAGAVVSILNTRLSSAASLTDLFGELMALIVLPYEGAGAAREERTRPAPRIEVPADAPPSAPVRALRLTYRTALVLEAIGQQPGISNLGVARHAQITDQGQMSKLLSRLRRNGLVLNTARGHGRGAPNEWRLTPAGQELERDIREHHKREAA
jgi:DNA-binding MarR family transcriptional regulator